MQSNQTTSEKYFYWLAFIVALALRLVQLGAAPLADGEATWALQALALARGQAVTLGGQPAYILLTSLLFSLSKNTNFLTRLLPALAGSLLVWLPYYFRRGMRSSAWLHRAGLVLAFGMAVDPGLVSLSRQAGSLMPALTFTVLTLAALYNHRMVWVGVFAGLVLLSGPAFLQGLLILGFAWVLIRWLVGRLAEPQPGPDDLSPVSPALAPLSLPKAIPTFVLILVLVGTLFLRAPQGLAALANSLSAYLAIWVVPSGIPAVRLPASLLIYQFIVLVFALIAIARIWLGRHDRQPIRQLTACLGLWALVAILLPLLYSGHQVGDMAWALIPLWALASLEIGRSLHPAENRVANLAAICLTALLFLLAVIGWMNLLAIGRDPSRALLYLAIIFGALLLGVIAALLVATGWSVDAAKVGMVGALCLSFGLQFISNTVGMTILHQNDARELWSPATTTAQADLLLTSLADFSSWNTGLRNQLEIVALDAPPSLQWALRDFQNVNFVTALSSTASPPVVITLKGNEEPILAQKYRGEDFVWSQSPSWQGAYPPNFINWLTFRAAPLSQTQVILWVREDIFPGDTAGTTGASSTSGGSAP
jgi:hypothetical protein